LEDVVSSPAHFGDAGMINVYDNGRLVLVCSSKDWRIFLPGVEDYQFVWVWRKLGYRWTWDWA
jgi:hypothetical protein